MDARKISVSFAFSRLLSSLWVKWTLSSFYVFLFPIKNDSSYYIIFLLQISLIAVITVHHWCGPAAIVFIALFQCLGVITFETSNAFSYLKPIFLVRYFEAYILSVCFISPYLFIHSGYFIISFRCSNIILKEHIQGHTKWTPCLSELGRNLALWQEFGTVWEPWVMIPAPAFACINCWSPLNNWLRILVNTSSENVCGGACLHRPRRTSVHFPNPLNNLALICVTGRLSQGGPLLQSRDGGSLGWVVLAGFVEAL